MKKSQISNSKSQKGFSLVEAAVSAVLAGVMIAAAMRAVAGSMQAQYRTAERATARFLAEGLLSEITAKAYWDPRSSTPTLIGLDAGEISTSKANYNDVDDFNAWTESPPQFSSGTAMPNLSGWSRSVQVAWVNPSSLSQVSASGTGAKRITVTVKHNGVVVATKVALRTNAP